MVHFNLENHHKYFKNVNKIVENVYNFMNQTLYYVWGCSHYQSSIDSRVMLRRTKKTYCRRRGKKLRKNTYKYIHSTI